MATTSKPGGGVRKESLTASQAGMTRLRDKGGASPKTLNELTNGYVNAARTPLQRQGLTWIYNYADPRFSKSANAGLTKGLMSWQGMLWTFAAGGSSASLATAIDSGITTSTVATFTIAPVNLTQSVQVSSVARLSFGLTISVNDGTNFLVGKIVNIVATTLTLRTSVISVGLSGNTMGSGAVVQGNPVLILRHPQTNHGVGVGTITGNTTLTLTSVSSGSFGVGDQIAIAGTVVATITAFGSGTGGTGTYTITSTSNSGSTTITAYQVLSKIHYSRPYLGFPYVVAEFNDGLVAHYWLQIPPSWTGATRYVANQMVQPNPMVSPNPALNGFYYLCQQVANPPAWTPLLQHQVYDVVQPTTYNGWQEQAYLVLGAVGASTTSTGTNTIPIVGSSSTINVASVAGFVAGTNVTLVVPSAILQLPLGVFTANITSVGASSLTVKTQSVQVGAPGVVTTPIQISYILARSGATEPAWSGVNAGTGTALDVSSASPPPVAAQPTTQPTTQPPGTGPGGKYSNLGGRFTP